MQQDGRWESERVVGTLRGNVCVGSFEQCR